MEQWEQHRSEDKKLQGSNMSRNFFHLFIFSLGTGIAFVNPNPVQSSYCSKIEHECKKKCDEERINCIQEIEMSGLDAEKELEKELLCIIDNTDIVLRKCYKSCSDARRQCNEEHPESGLEDKVEGLSREVGRLRLEQEEIKQREWELRKELTPPPQWLPPRKRTNPRVF